LPTAQVKRPPTIRDVARHAKVSAATVSRVLTAPERVSIQTRERVLKAVLDTGYTVNEAARSLRRQRARTLLAAVPELDNTYYSTVLDAVIAVAQERGYGVLATCRLGDDPAPRLAEYFLSNRADGLLIFDGMLQTRKLHSLSSDGRMVPLVAAYDELPDPQIHSVITDNLESAERAVKHLVDYGHTRIGHVAGLSRNIFPNERLVGFRKAMFENRLGLKEEWIFQGDYSMDSGLAAAAHFAALKDRPTAIFSANDDMAIGLIAGLRTAGIDCPRDISVIGFDDIAMSRAYFPALTTMRQPRGEIGRLATETLISLIEGDLASAAPVRLVLRSELVVRDSTRRLKA
jgi:LacI family repressor for deo operon, udp, cdd, tsx, nupC, and nupG